MLIQKLVLQKLQACVKLSRDVLNEKEVADKFAALIAVWEKYMILVVYLKKNDMGKFKRTQDKCKNGVPEGLDAEVIEAISEAESMLLKEGAVIEKRPLEFLRFVAVDGGGQRARQPLGQSGLNI